METCRYRVDVIWVRFGDGVGDGLGCARGGNLRAGLGIFGGMGVVRGTGWNGVEGGMD